MEKGYYPKQRFKNSRFGTYLSSSPCRTRNKIPTEVFNEQHLQSLKWDFDRDFSRPGALGAIVRGLSAHIDPIAETLESWNSLLLSAKLTDSDTPTWEEAMNGPLKEGYWEACCKELHTLEKVMDAWEVVEKQSWMNVLPSTWAFRCKRFPDGMIKKLKACFCARGHC